MSNIAFLLLGPTVESQIRWATSSAGAVLARGAVASARDLPEIADRLESAALVVALLPGEQVACRRMPSAPRSAAKLKAAAGYLMEDELGQSADLLHIGAASSREVAVAFAARADLVGAWTAAFAEAGVECDILSADYLALPSSTQEAAIVVDGDRVIAAFAGVGLAAEAGLFCSLAEGLFADAPSTFRVIGEESLIKFLPAASAVDWLGPANEALALGEFARALSAATPPNFLRARLIHKRALAAAIGPWRRAGVLAACLACIALFGLVADGWRYARLENLWTAGARALHEATFPEAANEDPVAFARRRLADGGAQASLLVLASRFAAAIDDGRSVEVERIRYNAARGEFVASLRGGSDAAIETLKTDLAAAGVAAQDSGGFRKSGEFWFGDLTARLQ